MREYGQVQCAFWTSTDAKAMSPEARMLAVYLLTCPHSNGLGCYALPDGYVMADLKWCQETVSKGFEELSQTGFAKRCKSTDFVLIPNFLKWNTISNPNVAAARAKEFEVVSKKAEIFSELCESMLRHGSHWKPEFETLLKGFAKGLGKQDPTLPDPNQPDPKERVNAPAGPPPCPQQAIVDSYHDELPTLPRVRVVSDTTAAALRRRWREDEQRQTLDWWRAYFAYVRESCPFLVGKCEPGPNRDTPFLADFAWLVGPKNFEKVVNGRYEEGKARAG